MVSRHHPALGSSYRGIQRVLSSLRLKFDAFLTMGILAPSGAAGSAEDEALLAEVEAALTTGAFRPQFGRMIAERFDADTEAARAGLFLRLAIVGTLGYDLLLLVDWFIIPDVMFEALVIQLAIATPIACLCILAVARLPSLTNGAAMITATTMMLCTIAILMMSRSEHANLYACFFGLIVISVNNSQAWSFSCALIFAALTQASVTAAVLMHPVLDLPSRIFAITILACASQYSLIGNYRIDAGLRRAYLFALRESLRAGLLARSNASLKTLADIDGLTRIGNRRFFDDFLSRIWQACEGQREVALLIVDIDHFKRLNDTRGHLAGDACLQRVAQCLADLADRHGAALARYGGEEFVALLPGAGIIPAFAVAEEMRRAVGDLEVEVDDGTFRMTVSVGCAAGVPGPDLPSSALFAAADAALYRAKRAGRDRTQCADHSDLRWTPAVQAASA